MFFSVLVTNQCPPPRKPKSLVGTVELQVKKRDGSMQSNLENWKRYVLFPELLKTSINSNWSLTFFFSSRLPICNAVCIFLGGWWTYENETQRSQTDDSTSTSHVKNWDTPRGGNPFGSTIGLQRESNDRGNGPESSFEITTSQAASRWKEGKGQSRNISSSFLLSLLYFSWIKHILYL